MEEDSLNYVAKFLESRSVLMQFNCRHSRNLKRLKWHSVLHYFKGDVEEKVEDEEEDLPRLSTIIYEECVHSVVECLSTWFLR